MNMQSKSGEAEGNGRCNHVAAGYLAAGLSLAAGAALGAAAMYLLDPNRGSVRRARLREQAASRVKKSAREAAGKAEDLLNRAKGAVAKAGAAIPWPGAIDDDVLASRIRSQMGHVTAHAHAIESEVKDGQVTLRGNLPAGERRRIVEEVSGIPGVKAVQDLLAGGAPA